MPARDVFSEAYQALAEQIARLVIEQINTEHQPDVWLPDNRLDPIDPVKLYDVAQAAVYLGMSTSSIYKLNDVDLPRQNCGNDGKSVRFYGSDLIAFLKARYTGKTLPHEVHALQTKEKREAAPVLLRLEKGAAGIRGRRRTLNEK